MDYDHNTRKVGLLAPLHKDDSAKRVARYAQEKASYVMRHEEEIQKLKLQYEQQLADGAPQHQHHASLTELDRLRSSLIAMQERADEAEAGRDAADTASLRLKKKLKKSEQQRIEQLQKSEQQRIEQLQKVRCSLLALAAPFSLWAHLTFANAAQSKGRTEKSTNVAWCRMADSVVHTRQHMFLISLLHGWATVVQESVHEARLKHQQDEASMKSLSAIATVRLDMRALRLQARRAGLAAAGSRALVHLAAPFSAWAREALRVKFERSSQLAEVNSEDAEAARQAQMQLEEVQAQCSEQLAAFKNEVEEYCIVATTATRAKRHALTISDRLCFLVQKEQSLGVLHAALFNWNAALMALKQERARDRMTSLRSSGSSSSSVKGWCISEQTRLQVKIHAQGGTEACFQRCTACSRAIALLDRMSNMADRESNLSKLLVVVKAWNIATSEALQQASQAKLLAEASVRADRAVECVRTESRNALKMAWGSSTEFARQEAALQRRKAAESRMSAEKDIFQELLGERPRSSQRPGTAKEVERELELAEEQARCRAMAMSLATPSTAANASSEVLIMPEASSKVVVSNREDRAKIVTEILRLREHHQEEEVSRLAFLILQTWRRQSVETLSEKAGKQKRQEVQAAREGRKGLFIAALRQQARYWVAKAFAEWRRVLLEACCEHLRSAHPSTGPQRSSTPARHQVNSARCSAETSIGSTSGTSYSKELVTGASRIRRTMR